MRKQSNELQCADLSGENCGHDLQGRPPDAVARCLGLGESEIQSLPSSPLPTLHVEMQEEHWRSCR